MFSINAFASIWLTMPSWLKSAARLYLGLPGVLLVRGGEGLQVGLIDRAIAVDVANQGRVDLVALRWSDVGRSRGSSAGPAGSP